MQMLHFLHFALFHGKYIAGRLLQELSRQARGLLQSEHAAPSASTSAAKGESQTAAEEQSFEHAFLIHGGQQVRFSLCSSEFCKCLGSGITVLQAEVFHKTLTHRARHIPASPLVVLSSAAQSVCNQSAFHRTGASVKSAWSSIMHGLVG